MNLEQPSLAIAGANGHSGYRPRVFLATPITPLIAKNNEFCVVSRDSIQAMLASLRAEGFDVFCAIEREEWGKALMSGHECTRLDYEGLVAADVMVALCTGSFGVHVELGWASAHQKPILLLVNETFGIKTPLVEGLYTVSTVDTLTYQAETLLPAVTTWQTTLYPAVLDFIAQHVSHKPVSLGVS
ncbi:MAG: hypothetical protein H0T73_19160 [Ardenticatenales bacterium]|nr:hypothetical protein [Ardenticatenales bacterium]